MEEKYSGIVLGGVNFGENDKILNVFTLEQGVVSAKIKGVKKAGAKLKFASEPFCFAEFLFAKTGKNRTVTGATLIESFYPIREDLEKYFAGGTILEFCKKFLIEGICDKALFSLVIQTLKDLAFSDVLPHQTLIKFLLSALSLSGYAINVNGCFSCQAPIKGRVFFDYEYGGFFCEECRTDNCREVSFYTLSALNRLENGENLPKDQLVKPLKLLDFYITQKTEEKLSSLKELINISN